MIVTDLGRMEYRAAWARQEEAHAAVAGGGEEQLLLVEHDPVITFGRRPGSEVHLNFPVEALRERGVDVVQSDRGGDITFHGPGQIVAYPIVSLLRHHLSVGGYVKCLERAAIRAVGEFGIQAHLDPAAIGVWTELGKICALGVRIRKGVSLHGIALNVTTDLRYFDLIIPCGLHGRRATSMQQVLGDRTPPMERVKRALVDAIGGELG